MVTTMPKPGGKRRLMRLLSVATVTAIIAVLSVMTAYAHDVDNAAPFPACPDGDPSTYTRTCLGDNQSTVYVYMDNLVVGNEYKYRFDIANRHRRNLSNNHPCEGLGFHGHVTDGVGQHGWTYFRAQEINEVRTAQVDTECGNQDRIMYWKVLSTDMDAHNYSRKKHRSITTNPPGVEHPWLNDEAYVVHEADGIEQFLVSLYFNNDIVNDDVAETYETRINLEGGTGCTDTEHNNLDTAIAFTEDDLIHSGSGDMSYSAMASVGGANCADGTYYMEVEVWDTTGGDRTLIFRTDNEFEYAAADSD